MNRELATVLKGKISNLPFVDKIAGMVQTVEDVVPDENGNPRRIRYPMAYDTNVPADPYCSGSRERDLMPDERYRSIIYFEDFGVAATGRSFYGNTEFVSNIRIVGWFNKGRLVGDSYATVSGYCMAAIIGRLAGKNPASEGVFRRLSIKVSRMPPQDATVFSRYTYDQTVRQYLLPPFEVGAVDLACTYIVPAKCLPNINFNNPDPCY